MRPSNKTKSYFTHLPTERIQPNPYNPRKIFDQESLDELAASLSTHGVLQPLIVYEKASFFTLICGERRLRAARQAHLPKVPAIVHPVAPEDPVILSMMLIENLQRKEVDLVNESAAIRLLIEEHNWSVARVSRSLGAGAGFIRKRYLLTKFSDVLSAYTANTISYSEAIELATLEDEGVRKWFFRRIESGELADIKKLTAAVARDKQIRSMLAKGIFLTQPLNRSEVEFQVEGLPYCDAKCPHYFRVSWDERQQYKVPHQKPGWAEYCGDKCGSCYAKKVREKQAKYAALRALRVKRPISDHDSGSMLWLNHDGKTCRTCKWMIEASDLEEAGSPLPKKIHAACSCPSSQCYNTRANILNRRAERLELQIRKADELKKKLLLRESRQPASRHNPPRPQLTKRECAFVLVQHMCYLGGQSRLQEFAGRHGWIQNLPKHISSQIRYIRNKVLDELSEAELHEALLTEACLSAAYSDEPIPPLKFRRDLQSEIPIQINEADE
jgi:ParB/RepB/Spo0J family partition protein